MELFLKKNLELSIIFCIFVVQKQKRYDTYNFTYHSRNSFSSNFPSCHMEDNSLLVQSDILQYMVYYNFCSVVFLVYLHPLIHIISIIYKWAIW